eukprot:1137494-Amphidinium_carterae.1
MDFLTPCSSSLIFTQEKKETTPIVLSSVSWHVLLGLSRNLGFFDNVWGLGTGGDRAGSKPVVRYPLAHVRLHADAVMAAR